MELMWVLNNLIGQVSYCYISNLSLIFVYINFFFFFLRNQTINAWALFKNKKRQTSMGIKTS